MTDQERKAMEMALEALENCAVSIDSEWGDCRSIEEMRETGEYTRATTKAIEALRQALAQPEQEPFELEWPDYNDLAMGCGLEDRNITDRYEAMQYGWDEAISRISEYLPDVLFTAPPSKSEQEPELVAVLVAIIGNWGRVEWVDGVHPKIGDRMYSAPPSKPWVSLTDEERSDVIGDVFGNIFVAPQKSLSLARAIEAALKEKNT